MVFDTLYGMDDALRATSHMVEGYPPIADTVSIPPLPVRGSGAGLDGATLPLRAAPPERSLPPATAGLAPRRMGDSQNGGHAAKG
jgi:hypothetical protein